METPETKQHMMPIVIAASLLAIGTVAIVLYFIPSSNPVADQMSTESGQIALQDGLNTQFNTSVLQRAEYKELDASLFLRGLLPVAPPTGTGKTNIFR